MVMVASDMSITREISFYIYAHTDHGVHFISQLVTLNVTCGPPLEWGSWFDAGLTDNQKVDVSDAGTTPTHF